MKVIGGYFELACATLGACLMCHINAMPSPKSLNQARPVVTELLADDIIAVKAGRKSAEKAGDAAIALIASAETEAAKYLLIKDAMALYIRGKAYDKEADTVERLTKEISSITTAELVDFIKVSAKGVRGKDAPRLLSLLRVAQAQVNAVKDIAAAKAAVAAKPEDVILRRKLVELYILSENWKEALTTLAPLGMKESQVAAAEKGKQNLSLAADYWWTYQPLSVDVAKAIRKHAVELYSRCLDEGELTGLRRNLAEKRIRQVEVASEPEPEPQKSMAPAKLDGLYMVVDLSGGPTATKYPVTYLDDVPRSGWTDEYKTTRLVLRKVRRGSYTMGSPKSEPGRESQPWMGKETQHKVTLTMDFYLGIFEVTQKQWELVMGTNPSQFKSVPDAPKCPVECVSYAMIRGSNLGCTVPIDGRVDSGSFMYKLRARTGFNSFDLPSECQWEYACRAGTTTCTYIGKYDEKGLGAIAWLKANSGNRIRAAGERKPNAWGFYDMIGNAIEWQLDRVSPKAELMTAKDYIGSVNSGNAVGRGGSWSSETLMVRTAIRVVCYNVNTVDNRYGFRVAIRGP